MAVGPVKFYSLTFADDPDRVWARFALHHLSLRLLRKRTALGG